MTDFTTYIAAVEEILEKESWNFDSCLGLNALLDILRKEHIEYEDIDSANTLIDEIIEYTTYSDGCEYLDTFAAIRARLDEIDPFEGIDTSIGFADGELDEYIIEDVGWDEYCSRKEAGTLYV